MIASFCAGCSQRCLLTTSLGSFTKRAENRPSASFESLPDSIEELKHDPHNRQQRHIADLAQWIAKLQAKLKRVGERLDRQQCLNSELKRRIAELEFAFIVRDFHNSSIIREQTCRSSG